MDELFTTEIAMCVNKIVHFDFTKTLKIQYSHPLHNLQIPVSQSGMSAGSHKMLRKRCLILFPPTHMQRVITRNICFEL